MKEVSCKVFELLFPALKRKGIDLARVVEGTSVSVDTITNRKERIDWPDYVAIMKNIRPHFSDEEYVEIGREWMRSPGLKFAFVVARLLFSAMDFYRWMNKPREGVGNQMFSCIIPKHREVSENHIELDLTLPEGFEVCWDFYVISSGNMEELPRLLGLPPSQVTLTPIHQGARFDIIVPRGTPLFARMWRAITWPFTARAAAKELKAAHETLLDRYEELEDARRKLDAQAQRLRTAQQISDIIHADLDLQRTLETIAKALVEEAAFARVELTLDGNGGSAAHGQATKEAAVERALAGRDTRLGILRAVPKSGSSRTEREELLAFLEPTLAMALENAIAYRDLAEYKSGLEKLVDQRTAELRVARDALAGTVEQLRDAQDAREKFFGNISHEIRTPLSLIMLAAGDVERRLGHVLDDRGRNGLVAVTDSARKLLRLVDELLLLAAGQAEKLTLSIEATNLSALLQQLVATWRPAAENASLALSVRVPEGIIANVDPVAIERIASNLMSNAIKYTPKGGRVELEVVVEGEHVRLSVLDTGPGIDPDLASRLFGRFERAAGADRKKAGTGIGLALVKQLVELHAGTVAALPRASGGTEMRVLLPASIITAEDKPLPPTFLRTTHAPTGVVSVKTGDVFRPEGLSAGTIVIAEDEPRLAESIARLLSEEYTVVVALDGVAAVAMVEQHQPQLLITDVDMPGMTGIELSRKFREITGDRLAPIIILSAVLDLRTRIAGLEAGAVDYVGKPFDPAELRARVHAQFRMRDMALRLHRAEQLSAMGILTSGLAHELRNPANGIINALAPLSELLPGELIGPDTGPGQLIDVMKSCADQIGFLTRQLLGFRSNAMLELRPASLPQLVQRAVKLAHRALNGVDVRTRVDMDGPVLCAAPLLVQVLTNLIENAGHAAGRGGWVELTATTSGARVIIEVTDSGSGIPAELRERVFEPFFTTKAPGVGTGLGLPLARTIVHKHGGLLEIRERAGRMAFVIELNAQSNVAQSASAV